MSLRFFARIFNRLIPFDEDKQARAGWSVVRLDPKHPFHRAANAKFLEFERRIKRIEYCLRVFKVALFSEFKTTTHNVRADELLAEIKKILPEQGK